MGSNLLKCPGCKNFSLDEFINSDGGGSLYCLDSCGYEEKIDNGTYAKSRPDDMGYTRTPKKPKPKRNR
jgi:hypothetical protein